MKRLKATINLCLLLGLVFCLETGGHAIEKPAALDAARLAANTADDNASTLEGRQAASKKLEEAAGLFLEAGESLEAARVLNRLGRLQLILNAPQAALDSHQKALELLKQWPDPQVEVDNLNSQAEVYLRLQKRDQVAAVLQKSLALSEHSGYTRGQAQALLALSDSQNYDNHLIALGTAQKALSLWQIVGDKAWLARSYAQIGRIYQAQNNLPEATQNYEEVRKLWRELNNPTEEARVLINMGYIEYRKGDWQREISYQTQAQALIDEKAEPAMMGQIASGLAEAFNESGLPEVGLEHYQRALQYFLPTQNSHAIAYLTYSIGRTYYLLGKYPEAIAQFQQVLADQTTDSFNVAASYQYLGRVHIATEQYELARQNLDRALVIYQRTGNPREAAFVQGLLGQLYDEQGQVERARPYYQEALTAFNSLSDRLNQAAIHYALGRLEMKRQDYVAAEEHLQQSIKLTEDIRRVSTSGDLAAAFSATVHDRYETYIECFMRQHQTNPAGRLDVRAFETSELARGRSLAELLRNTQTNLAPGLDPELAQREKSLRQSLRVKENSKINLLAKQYTLEELNALEEELARLEAEYRRVNDTITARHPSYAQINQPTGWDLRQIQEQVVADDQSVLLEYSLGSAKSYVWAVTRDDIHSYELPAQASINEAAQELYQLLKTAGDGKHDNELKLATQELSRLILSPVASELNKQRVIVVPDGALSYIPFQILPASSASDEPLVATSEIINAPSASILGQLREETERRQAPTKILAAFGDPVFASNYAQYKDTSTSQYIASAQPLVVEQWQHALRDIEPEGDSFNPATIHPLFYSKLELAKLRDVAGPDSFVSTGFDATREKLAEADLTKYAILHFATHGILDPKRPEKSGLFLSMVNRDGRPENGFVGLQDIYNLHTPVDLVVLSACRTGLGKDVRGEGLIGLTRGFMYAGASSVVASLWKVDDEATAELMKRFYVNMLQREMPPAAALRAAQNSIRQQPQWRAPYFWAAFTLQGEYRHSIKHQPASSFARPAKVAIGLAVLLLLISGAWWYRHAARLRAVKPTRLT